MVSHHAILWPLVILSGVVYGLLSRVMGPSTLRKELEAAEAREQAAYDLEQGLDRVPALGEEQCDEAMPADELSTKSRPTTPTVAENIDFDKFSQAAVDDETSSDTPGCLAKPPPAYITADETSRSVILLLRIFGLY
jgi:hypothetical protein